MANGIMDGGDALIEVLNANSVEYIFASPGSEWPPLWEALSRRQAEGEQAPIYVTCRHESLAIGAAAGYHRATGRLPAVIMHTTVGSVNAAMAMRAALHDGTPMVVISGESIGYGESPGLDPGAQWLHELSDLGGPEHLVKPVVKWSASVRTRETLADTLHRACRLAVESPPGPTYVDAPIEIMMEQIETIVPAKPEVEASLTADAGTLGEIARLLAGAERPVVLTEFFGRDPSAVPALVEIAEKLALPVLEVPAVAAMNFPTDNALHQGYDAASFLQDADVVLLLDSTTPWHPPSKGPAQARIVKFSADPDMRLRPYAGYPAHVTVPGSVGANVKALAPIVRAMELDVAASKRIKARRATLAAAHDSRRTQLTEKALAEKDNNPISPSWAAHVINQVIPDHAMVVTELITHRGFIEKYRERRTPGATLQAFSGLGQGLTNAVGVKTAHPDNLVVAIMGDGAFNYNPVPAAYGFAQQHGLPFLTIILNNHMYQSQQNSINRSYPEGFGKEIGPTFATGITPHPDYAKLVEAFGGWGAAVTKPDQIAPTLEEAVRHVQAGQSALVDLLLAE